MPLYQIDANNLKPIKKTEFKYERDLQKLTENNLEEVFNLKFVASELIHYLSMKKLTHL